METRPEQLLPHEEVLRIVTDAVPVLISYVDTGHRYRFNNRAYEQWFGHDRSQLAGHHMSDVLGEAAYAAIVPYLDRAFSGETVTFEREIPYREGGTRFIQATYLPHRDAEGNVVGIAVLVTDLSERRRMEQSLEAARADLERQVRERTDDLRTALDVAHAANAAKDVFLAHMSHEMRTPINAIRGFADLMLGDELSDSQRGRASLIRESAESLLGLVSDLLDFFRIAAGKMVLEEAPLSIRGLVAGALRSLALKADAAGLELCSRVGADVPDCLVGDAQRLRQILVNLVDNAVKFTPRGEVLVEVDGEAAPRGEVLLHVSVRDTGIGIPPERLEQVFQPFVQGEPYATRKVGGTGLGLSICQRLVDMMGGELRVESRTEQGSTFHFTVRLARGPEAHLPRLDGECILIVEDNATLRRCLREALEGAGAQAREAACIGEAREALAANLCPSWIVLDASLPGEDPFSWVPDLGGLPCLMLIPSASTSAVGRCKAIDAHWLTKPVAVLDLLELLGRRGSRELSPASPPRADRPLRVLLAEDNPLNALLAKEQLRLLGHEVVAVQNGRDAVEICLRDAALDLVLMDVQMPDMDGLEATRRLRQEGSRIPIVAMTAHALKGDRERCLEAGMNDYLAKPCTVDELGEVIGRTARAGVAFTLPAPLAQPGILQEVVSVVTTEARASLQALHDSLAEDDAESAARSAHRLKGTALALKASRVTEILVALEALCGKRALVEARDRLPELDEAFRELLEGLRAAAAESAPTS